MHDHAGRLIARVRRRLARQGGFTLIELMVAVAIGIVVMLGLMNLVDSSGRAGTRVIDKAETTQRLRIGMEKITRLLRTQVCLNSVAPPIETGDASSVTFYSDTTGPTDSAFRPKKIRLTFSTTGNGSVTKETWNTTSATPAATLPVWTFPATDPPNDVILTNIGRIGSTAFLRYHGFASELTAPLNPSTTDPLPINSVAKAVRVDVALEARPESNNLRDTRRRTSLTSRVYARNTDFSTTDSTSATGWGPKCF